MFWRKHDIIRHTENVDSPSKVHIKKPVQKKLEAYYHLFKSV